MLGLKSGLKPGRQLSGSILTFLPAATQGKQNRKIRTRDKIKGQTELSPPERHTGVVHQTDMRDIVQPMRNES